LSHETETLGKLIERKKTLQTELDSVTEQIKAQILCLQAQHVHEANLTDRQREILKLITEQHLCNKEIADVLSISIRTVKFHISDILRKMGKQSRHDL
jgi:DNA-binding NarL/FixJ family response regulator